MGTVLDFMGKDHDRLDNIFREFRSIKDTDRSEVRRLFHEFKIGLQRHIVWEEEFLFPLFESRTGMHDSGPTVVMRMEHRKIKEFLERIHNNLSRGADIYELEEGLIKVLTEHNNKEETILYPWIDNSVNEEVKEDVFIKMKNMPSERYNHCCE